MRGRYEEFTARGADVAAIGMGTTEQAADFRHRSDIHFPLLVDRTKESYRALELRRGSLMDVIGPAVWIRGVRSILSGNFQGSIKQDPYQLGGTIVVAPGGEVLFTHVAGSAADNAPVDDILAALP